MADLIEKIDEFGLQSLKRVVVSEIEGTENHLVTDNREIDPKQIQETLDHWKSESISKVMLLDMTPVRRLTGRSGIGTEDEEELPEFSFHVTKVSNGVETIVVAVKSVDP
ncbi:MAG: hypothetical protein JW701_05970 [Kosmotogaceae bacterium]|nr:hypothetical protein [Kosmotogaceae bacterium]